MRTKLYLKLGLFVCLLLGAGLPKIYAQTDHVLNQVKNSEGITYSIVEDTLDRVIATTPDKVTKWEVRLPGQSDGSLFLEKDNVIFLGIVSYLGTSQLLTLDPVDGHLLWKMSLDQRSFSDLLLSEDDETLYIAQLSQGEQISAINLFDRTVRWTYPLHSFGKNNKLSFDEAQKLIIKNDLNTEIIDLTKMKPSPVPIFKDIKGHWAENSIKELTKSKIISGFADATFRPENKVTREQAVVMLLRFIHYPLSKTQLTFYTDISPSRWSSPYIQTAFELGILNENTTAFSPGEPIDREEMSVMVSKVLKLTPDASAVDFEDTEQMQPDNKGYIGAVVKAGIINGFEDRTFKPHEKLTRAQSAAILNQSLKIIQ
jgi:hypothetical protein